MCDIPRTPQSEVNQESVLECTKNLLVVQSDHFVHIFEQGLSRDTKSFLVNPEIRKGEIEIKERRFEMGGGGTQIRNAHIFSPLLLSTYRRRRVVGGGESFLFPILYTPKKVKCPPLAENGKRSVGLLFRRLTNKPDFVAA